MQPAETIAPDPAELFDSLRDIGYTLQTALADLIDNSITAGARRVEVAIESARSDSHIAILDDGAGMGLDRLISAMKLGSQGPRAHRSATDLGRFGLGLKTASLSQGRCITVITKTDATAEPVIRRWDVDHVDATKRWELLMDPTRAGQVYMARLKGMPSGTAVVIEKLDRPAFLNLGERGTTDVLALTLSIVRQHLGMVFHRFIEDGLELRLGPSAIAPWDPFLRRYSTTLPEEVLHFLGQPIGVAPFVLPHYSRITSELHESAAGPDGWNAHQGFYIYRCRRLIIPGSWLNLHLRKEEHFKLARIRVDLPNGMDEGWHLNVMKSHVAAPALLRDDFKRIAGDVRRQAGEVYRFRGEREAPQTAVPERHVWRRDVLASGVRFRVDRTHPALRALLHVGCEHEAILEQVLKLIESTVPVAAMLQEPARATEGSLTPTYAEIGDLLELFRYVERYFIARGHTRPEAREKLLSSEPFSLHRNQLQILLDSTQLGTNPPPEL
jgi:hypothetical protein